jgi:hypothetical protein
VSSWQSVYQEVSSWQDVELVYSIVKLEEYRFGRMPSWKSVKLEGCRIDRMLSWKSVKLEGCRMDRILSWQRSGWQDVELLDC